MTLRLETVALAGGLDEASGKTSPRKGRLLGCENFETAFGVPGYRRIAGYERFDGQAAPSSAGYWVVPFDAGTAAIVAGDTVDFYAATATVLGVHITSGSWGAGAAGFLATTFPVGSVADNDPIKVGGVQKATVNGTVSAASSSTTGYATDVIQARTVARALIAQPTGYGAILGVAIFRDEVYCLRNDDSSAVTATLWKSSSSGWTSVRTGLRGGGVLHTVNATFTGTAGAMSIYGVDGKNRAWAYTGSTFTFAPNIYSTEGTSSSNVTPATGAKTFTTEAGRGWTTSHTLRVYSATNAGKYMVGTVTSYGGTTLVINVSSAAGAAATDWHICREDGVDRPFDVQDHLNHLFLAYPLGQLQHSDLGAPFTFSTTAGVIGQGDEIVDMLSMRAGVMAVFLQTSVNMLYGSSKTDWQLKPHSKVSNSRTMSAAEVGGNGIFLSDAGIESLSGSQNFGDFDAANLAGDARTTLARIMANYKATSLVKSDSQYRIYGGSKEVFVLSWQGATPDPRNVECTRLRYEHQAVCAAFGTVSGEEYIVFGTDDGWVMRERVGTTFDGANIAAFLRTSYWHSGAPQQKKRFRKVTLDCDAGQTVTISFKLDFDFVGPDVASTIQFDAEPSGGFYDTDNWDEFFWSNPEAAVLEANVEGVARYMSMLLWSEGDFEGFTVYGMSTQFSPLGLKR